jgi:hypothetical protein
MQVKISRVVYAGYIKDNRFIAYFDNAEFAMKYLTECYPTEEKHVEPIFVIDENTETCEVYGAEDEDEYKPEKDAEKRVGEHAE